MSDLRSVVQESWSRAVLAASSVEEQAQELIGKLTHAFQEGPLSAEGAQRLVSEVTGKLRDHRRELQSQVEDAVRRGIDRLRLPTRAELKALEERLEGLEARLAKAPNAETSSG